MVISSSHEFSQLPVPIDLILWFDYFNFMNCKESHEIFKMSNWVYDQPWTNVRCWTRKFSADEIKSYSNISNQPDKIIWVEWSNAKQCSYRASICYEIWHRSQNMNDKLQCKPLCSNRKHLFLDERWDGLEDPDYFATKNLVRFISITFDPMEINW